MAKPLSPSDLFGGITIDEQVGAVATDVVSNLTVGQASDLLYARFTEMSPADLRVGGDGGADASEPYRAAFAWSVAMYLNEQNVPLTPRVLNSIDTRPFLDRALALPDDAVIAWSDVQDLEPGDRWVGNDAEGVPLPKRYLEPIRQGEQSLYDGLTPSTGNPFDALRRNSAGYDATVAGLSPLAAQNVQIENPTGTAAMPTATPADIAAPVATATAPTAGGNRNAPAPVAPTDPAATTISDPFGDDFMAGAPGSSGTGLLEVAFDVEDLRNLIRIGQADLTDAFNAERDSYAPGFQPQDFPIGVGGEKMSAAQAMDYLHTLTEAEVTDMQRALGKAGYFDELQAAPILGDPWDAATEQAWYRLLGQSIQRDTTTTALLTERAQTYRARKIASQPALDMELAQTNVNSVAQSYMGRNLNAAEEVQFRIWLTEQQRETTGSMIGVDGVTAPQEFDMAGQSRKYVEDTFDGQDRTAQTNGRWYDIYSRVGYKLQYPEPKEPA